MPEAFHLTPEELATYVDGHSNAPTLNRLILHLADCDACFHELVALVVLMRNVANTHGRDPPRCDPSLEP